MVGGLLSQVRYRFNLQGGFPVYSKAEERYFTTLPPHDPLRVQVVLIEGLWGLSGYQKP